MSEYELELYKIIGGMIRTKRLDKGLTLDNVAKQLGVTSKTIQRYELGERKIKLNILMQLSSILDFDYQALMHEAQSKLLHENSNEIIYRNNLSEEELQIAIEISKNDALKELLNAARDASRERLLAYSKYLKQMNEVEKEEKEKLLAAHSKTDASDEDNNEDITLIKTIKNNMMK